jgi:hypothetical protein
LLVRITLQGGWVWVAAGGLDEGGAPQPLFNVGDSPQGWADVRRFVQAFRTQRGPFAATAPDQNRRKRFA